MIKVLMVEDEAGAVAVFSELLKVHAEHFSLMGVAQTVAEAIPLIVEKKPDVLVLDISLPDGTGFDVLDAVGDLNFELIFLTAHENFAIQAIKKQALDYLLKPLHSAEMHKVLLKVQSKILANKKEVFAKKIALNTIEGVEFINLDEILYLKASSAYTEIYLNKGHCIIASRTLKSFEEALSNPFVRVHNSYIVNMNFIKNFDKSDAVLYLENGQSIAVSKSKKDQLLKAVYKTF